MITVVYAREFAPKSFSKSVFLAGPSPRDEETRSWRPDMIKALEQAGYDGVVFSPEPRDCQFEAHDKTYWIRHRWSEDMYIDQVQWEKIHLDMADRIIFWVPREMSKMPAMTTNVEFGRYVQSGRAIYGRPHSAPKCTYLDWMYENQTKNAPLDFLEDVAKKVVEEIGPGVERSEGERSVPLDVWKSPQFREWYKALKSAGNRLDDAEVLWMFKIKTKVFAYALKVKVWVECEQRYKQNEFIISRMDTAVVVPFYRANQFLDTKIVMVREFRSPVRNSLGMVMELPGGSAVDAPPDCALASHELQEETGLVIDPTRFYNMGTRQLAATLSTHCSHVFTVHLNEHELQQMEKAAAEKTFFGVANETEKTYIEVRTIRQILETEVEIVMVSASWCGPCQKMLPFIDELKKQGINIVAIESDKEPCAFTVSGYPTFIFTVDGVEKSRSQAGTQHSKTK